MSTWMVEYACRKVVGFEASDYEDALQRCRLEIAPADEFGEMLRLQEAPGDEGESDI